MQCHTANQFQLGDWLLITSLSFRVQLIFPSFYFSVLALLFFFSFSSLFLSHCFFHFPGADISSCQLICCGFCRAQIGKLSSAQFASCKRCAMSSVVLATWRAYISTFRTKIFSKRKMGKQAKTTKTIETVLQNQTKLLFSFLLRRWSDEWVTLWDAIKRYAMACIIAVSISVINIVFCYSKPFPLFSSLLYFSSVSFFLCIRFLPFSLSLLIRTLISLSYHNTQSTHTHSQSLHFIALAIIQTLRIVWWQNEHKQSKQDNTQTALPAHAQQRTWTTSAMSSWWIDTIRGCGSRQQQTAPLFIRWRISQS